MPAAADRPKRPYRVFVSAGEVSGDKILADILRPLRARFPDMELRGLGGDAASAFGLSPLFPMRRTAFSGVWDVLRNAAFGLRMIAAARSALGRFRPDLVLLVDYPGLNLRLAGKARASGIPVLFVAPPQVWAYRNAGARARRAAALLEACHLHVLFPFEAAHYEAFAPRLSQGHFLSIVPGAARDLLCLCPGSRLPVLRRNLPKWLELLDAAGRLEGEEEICVLTPAHLAAEAETLVRTHAQRRRGRQGRRTVPIRVCSDKREAFSRARRAMAFPGTVTLELALQRIPTLVVAIIDPLTLALGRSVLARAPLALPNLILGAELFPEWAGSGPGPSLDLFLKLEEKRDAMDGWERGMARLETAIGPGNGAENAFAACLRILEGGREGA